MTQNMPDFYFDGRGRGMKLLKQFPVEDETFTIKLFHHVFYTNK